MLMVPITSGLSELLFLWNILCDSFLNNANIETYKIIVIFNSAWEKSFAQTEFNKEAITAKGWCPLTHNLLYHPEIIATAKLLSGESEAASSSRQTSSSVASSLNYNNGLASMVMADTLQNIYHKTVHQQIRNNQQEGELALAKLANQKKAFCRCCFQGRKSLAGS